MRYIYCDLEATCEENDRHWDSETIEIGAVMTDSADGDVVSEFGDRQFIRPILNTELTEFCTRLTTIRQEDVEEADLFPTVLHRFVEWCGTEPFVWCSWGAYDKNQLQKDCHRHGIEFPKVLENHRNLKEDYHTTHGHKRFGMAKALSTEGIILDGTHHRGIDDARNTAKLGKLIMPKIEQIEAEKNMIVLEITSGADKDDANDRLMKSLAYLLRAHYGYDTIVSSDTKIKIRIEY